MRGIQKSVIDCVLVNPGLATRINHIKIDEKGQKWEAGSDHSLIEITMKGYKQKYKLSKENMWNINANTKWQEFRKLLGEKLDEWELEVLKTNLTYDNE